MLKRFLCAMLAVIMLAALCSCSDGEVKEIETESEKTETETKTEEKKDEETEQTESGDFTVEEQVCFEKDGIKVTAKGVSESIWGKGIDFLVENNSDKDCSVSIDEMIVNNVMMSEPLFSVEVAAGKKSNDTLYFSSTELETAGITDICQVELYFYAYDDEEFERIFKNEYCLIKTSLFDKLPAEVTANGSELYNKDGVRILGLGVKENDIMGPEILLFIENKSDKNITVQCDDLSVNGFMISSIMSDTVYVNKYKFADIYLSSTSLEENGITEINDVEFSFEIFEADSFDTIDKPDPVKFSVKN